MSIDTGQNLVFNANFPTPGVDQPSQQFRDNFQIIKTAVESLQIITSNSASIFTLTPSLSSAGTMTLNASYTNNALILPINGPSVSAVTGMIRYNTSNSYLEFFNGTSWCQTLYSVSGSLSLATLTVTNRLTLGYSPTEPTDAATKSYVDALVDSISSSSLSNATASNSAVAAVQADLDNEKINRQNADTNLQTQITAIDANVANNSTQISAAYSQITSLTSSLSTESNTRAAADTAQQTTINTLTTQVNNAVTLSNQTSSELTAETNNREAADQYLYNIINTSITQSTINNAIAIETAARIQGDSNNSNSITIVANNLIAETNRAETAESGIINQLAKAVLTTGSTMSGNLIVNNAAIMMSNSAFSFDGANTQPVNISNTVVYFNNTNVLIAANSTQTPPLLSNSYMQVSGLPGSSTKIELVSFGGAGARYEGRVSGESNANVTSTTANTTLVSMGGFGHDGIEWTSNVAGVIEIVANSVWSLSNNETILRIGLTPNGNTTMGTVFTLDGAGDLSVTGNITATGTVVGLSDISLKTNVRTIPNALKTLNNLRGTLFTRDDLPGKPEQIGVIAQEVQEHVPQVVHNQNGLLGVSYGNLTALLIEAVKELSEKVKKLSAEIDNLKNP